MDPPAARCVLDLSGTLAASFVLEFETAGLLLLEHVALFCSLADCPLLPTSETRCLPGTQTALDMRLFILLCVLTMES